MPTAREIVEGREGAVARALAYPYEPATRSCVLVSGEALDPGACEVDLTARIPLLAYGSNASPAILTRKLAAAPDPVPLVRAALHDLDVVYSAHVSAYGSIPATLQRSPGAEAAVFVAYLTPAQLDLITATEPNYELKHLPPGSCKLEKKAGSRPDGLAAYVSRHGCLPIDGTPVALAAIEARARRFPTMTQRQMMEHARDLLLPGANLERFVMDCASQPVPSAGLDHDTPPE